jgi:hypothetical protein
MANQRRRVASHEEREKHFMDKASLSLGTIAIALALVFAGIHPVPVYAQHNRNTPVTQPPTMAGPAWHLGTITAKPASGKHRQLVVDKKPYTLMPDIRIAELYQSEPGIVNERQIGFHQLRIGQRVNIKVEGLRIYEIQVPLR